MTIKILPPPTKEPEGLLSRKQLAERWQVHVETLKRWETLGRIKSIKVGNKFLRYRLSDIEAFEKRELK